MSIGDVAEQVLERKLGVLSRACQNLSEKDLRELLTEGRTLPYWLLRLHPDYEEEEGREEGGGASSSSPPPPPSLPFMVEQADLHRLTHTHSEEDRSRRSLHHHRHQQHQAAASSATAAKEKRTMCVRHIQLILIQLLRTKQVKRLHDCLREKYLSIPIEIRRYPFFSSSSSTSSPEEVGDGGGGGGGTTSIPSSCCSSSTASAYRSTVCHQLSSWCENELEMVRRHVKQILTIMQFMPYQFSPKEMKRLLWLEEEWEAAQPTSDVKKAYEAQWQCQLAAFWKKHHNISRLPFLFSDSHASPAALLRVGNTIVQEGDEEEEGEEEEEEEEESSLDDILDSDGVEPEEAGSSSFGGAEEEVKLAERLRLSLPPEAFFSCQDVPTAAQWAAWLRRFLRRDGHRRPGGGAAFVEEKVAPPPPPPPLHHRTLRHHHRHHRPPLLLSLAFPKDHVHPNTRYHTICPRLTGNEVVLLLDRLHFFHLRRLQHYRDALEAYWLREDDALAAASTTTRSRSGSETKSDQKEEEEDEEEEKKEKEERLFQLQQKAKQLIKQRELLLRDYTLPNSTSSSTKTTYHHSPERDDDADHNEEEETMMSPLVANLLCAADPCSVLALPYEWSVLHIQLGEAALSRLIQCNFCETFVNTIFYNAVDFSSRLRRSSITLDRCPGFDLCLPCALYLMKAAACRLLRAFQPFPESLLLLSSQRRRRRGVRRKNGNGWENEDEEKEEIRCVPRSLRHSFTCGQYTRMKVIRSRCWLQEEGDEEEEGGKLTQRRRGGVVTAELTLRVQPASLQPVVFAWNPACPPPPPLPSPYSSPSRRTTTEQQSVGGASNGNHHHNDDEDTSGDELRDARTAALLLPIEKESLDWLYRHAMPCEPFGGARILQKKRVENNNRNKMVGVGSKGGEMCAVCLDPLYDSASSPPTSSPTSPLPTVLVLDAPSTVVTPCGHHFHRSCLSILQEECHHLKVPCPLCRRDVGRGRERREREEQEEKKNRHHHGRRPMRTHAEELARLREQESEENNNNNNNKKKKVMFTASKEKDVWASSSDGEEAAVEYVVRIIAPAAWVVASQEQQQQQLRVMVMSSWTSDGIIYNPTHCASAAMMCVQMCDETRE